MNNKPPGKDPKTPPPTTPRMPGGIMMTVLIIATIVIILQLVFSVLTGDRTERIHYNEFLAKLERGEVTHVEVQPDRLIITLAEITEDEDDDYVYEVVEPTPEPRNFVDRTMGNLITRQAELATIPPTRVYTGRMPDHDLLHRLRVNQVEFNHSIQNVNYFLMILQFLLPFLLIFGFFILIRRTMSGMMGGRGGIMGIGQSNAKVYM